MSKQQPLELQRQAGPSFYLTPNKRLSPGALLLSFVVACGVLFLVLHALRPPRGAGTSGSDDDDPSQVDTIYLGGPNEAPVAKRPPTGPSTVHPFVVVHLPRTGDQAGLIPDTTAGRLLFAWLAAFNGTDPSLLSRALPTPEADLTQAAQVELRRMTGGFTLLSAREVQPGLLVFRLHDQTPAATEVLGTLQLSGTTGDARIASFSLRAVPAPPAKAH